jgi:hypothetical protein
MECHITKYGSRRLGGVNGAARNPVVTACEVDNYYLAPVRVSDFAQFRPGFHYRFQQRFCHAIPRIPPKSLESPLEPLPQFYATIPVTISHVLAMT